MSALRPRARPGSEDAQRPDDLAAVPGQRHPEVGADLPRTDGGQVGEPVVGRGRRGRRADRPTRPSPCRATPPAGPATRPTPGARPEPAATSLHIGEQGDLTGRRVEQPGREIGETAQASGPRPRAAATDGPPRAGRCRAAARSPLAFLPGSSGGRCRGRPHCCSRAVGSYVTTGRLRATNLCRSQDATRGSRVREQGRRE